VFGCSENAAFLEIAPGCFNVFRAELFAEEQLSVIGEWTASRAMSVIMADSNRQGIGQGTNVTRTVGRFSDNFSLLLSARHAIGTIDPVARRPRSWAIAPVDFKFLHRVPDVPAVEVTFSCQGTFSRHVAPQWNEGSRSELRLWADAS
jgi:hypothetical protein